MDAAKFGAHYQAEPTAARLNMYHNDYIRQSSPVKRFRADAPATGEIIS